jgi:hypothetical protein
MSRDQWNKLSDCLNEQQITYYFPPSKNDGFIFKKGTEDGLEKFHIHSFEALDTGKENMVFSKLLPKSGNWRTGDEEVNLATLPTAEWVGACTGMDSSVIDAVRALAKCFTSLGAVGPT